MRAAAGQQIASVENVRPRLRLSDEGGDKLLHQEALLLGYLGQRLETL